MAFYFKYKQYNSSFILERQVSRRSVDLNMTKRKLIHFKVLTYCHFITTCPGTNTKLYMFDICIFDIFYILLFIWLCGSLRIYKPVCVHTDTLKNDPRASAMFVR
ncbi:hypothetical protein QTP88_024335 [Uroleucon formosanum]